MAITIIHHANTLNPTDCRDSASDSMALLGGADNFWSLNRQALSPEATLRITGRDILDEQELAMRFEEGYWSVVGNAMEVQQSAERKAILEVVAESGKPLRPHDIAKVLGKNVNTVQTMVRKMAQAGVLLRPYASHYALSPSSSVTSVKTVTSVKSPLQVVSTRDRETQRCNELHPIDNTASDGGLVTPVTVFTGRTQHGHSPTGIDRATCPHTRCVPLGDSAMCLDCKAVV